MAKKRASLSKRSKKSGRKRSASKGARKVTKAQAERMALLQLRIGRASHLYSMAAAFALAASGVLLLLTQPGRPLQNLPTDTKMVLPWLLPIVFLVLMINMTIAATSFVSAGSMMADVAEQHVLASGKAQQGIFFSATSFSGKLASGLRVAL